MADAAQYLVPGLRAGCEAYLASHLSPTNVCELWEAARGSGFVELSAACEAFVVAKGRDVLGEDGSVAELSEETLVELLLKDDLGVRDELEVGDVRWEGCGSLIGCRPGVSGRGSMGGGTP